MSTPIDRRQPPPDTLLLKLFTGHMTSVLIAEAEAQILPAIKAKIREAAERVVREMHGTLSSHYKTHEDQLVFNVTIKEPIP